MEKIVIKEQQLETEAQELYVFSRHLASDISFSEGELMFLTNMFHKYLIPAPPVGLLVDAYGLENEIVRIDNQIPGLKNKVSGLSRSISPLMNKQDKIIGTDLLEQLFAAEAEINLLFESVMAVRKWLFAFVDDILKAEPHDLLSIA
jgi:hypothetical protein